MTQESKTDSKHNEKQTQQKQKLLTAPSQEDGTSLDDDDRGKVRVFVYGSLKTHMGNNALLKRAGAKCLGLDSITGPFQMVSMGGFPGVVHTRDGAARTIFGEVWATDMEGLASLDMLEHHPSWYERFKYRTDILDRRAWMYTLPHGQGYLQYTHIPECIWRPHNDEIKFYNSQEGITISGS